MNNCRFEHTNSVPSFRSWCDGEFCPEYRDNRCVVAGQTLDYMRTCPKTITLLNNGVKYGDKFEDWMK